MNNTTTLITIALLFSSCFSMKESNQLKDQQEVQTRSQTTEQTLTNTHTKTNTITMTLDSTEEKYYVEIMPVGDFHYNPQTGFTGQASSIKLIGKRQSQTSTADSSASTTALSTQITKDTNQQSQQSSRHATKATTKKSPAINLLWLIPLVVALGIILRNKLAPRTVV